MNTTCRACLNYTDNGVRLLTLYKHYHYLPIMIWNCTGVKVDDSETDHKLPLCPPCADKLIDINEFRTMYLESHEKLKKNLKECLKYSPNDQKQPLNNNNSTHDGDLDGKNSGATTTTNIKGAKIKISAEDAYSNIIIDESQLLHRDQSNNKENNIVDIAMSMAGGSTVVGSTVTTGNSVMHTVSNGPAKKIKTSRPSKSRKKPNQTTMVQMNANHQDNKQLIYDDSNILDMNNGNGTDASELQYIILQSDTKIFSCSNCEQQFISEDFLKQHIQKAHPIVTELVQTPALSPMSLNQQVPTIYLCHFCESKQFTSEIQLSHHMYIHSEISAGTLSDNPFPFCSCEHCLPLQTEKMIVGDVEATEADLVAMQQTIQTIEEQSHVQQQHHHHQQQQQQHHHQQQQQQQQQTQQHLQQQQAPIRQIVQTASGKQQTLYSCSVCNKSTFKTEHRLKKHMRIHRNEQPFSCDICHKVYNASSSLKTHQRMVHGGVSNNSSSIANNTTTVANNQSTTTVTTVTTVSNDNIDKTTAGIVVDEMTGAVAAEAAITADGRIQCSICLKLFANAQKLNVHMSTAHGAITTENENDEEDPSSTDKINDIVME